MSWRRCLLIFLVLSVAAAIFRTFVYTVDSQAAVFTVLLSLSELFFLATFIAYWSFQSDSRLALFGILLCYCDCFVGLVVPRSYLSLGPPYMHSGVHVVGLGLFVWGLVREHGRWRTLLEKTTRAEEKYRAIFENSAVGITVADAHERIVSWNRLAEELLGTDADSLYMKPVQELYPPEEWEKLRELNVRQGVRQLHFETKMIKGDGELIDVSLSMSVVNDPEGNVQQSIGVFRDITETKMLWEELNQQRLRDALTGVYNRRYFNESIIQEIKRADRYGHHTSFIMGDVDSMKFVNDTYGHLVGDQILCGVAQVVEESVRAADIVIRYGGDEFLVVMPQTRPEDAQIAVDRIRSDFTNWLNDQVQAGAVCRDILAEVGFSMGVASYQPDSDVAVEEVLAQADEAMYHDKQAHLASPSPPPILRREK